MKPFEEIIPNLDLLTIFVESIDRPPPQNGIPTRVQAHAFFVERIF